MVHVVDSHGKVCVSMNQVTANLTALFVISTILSQTMSQQCLKNVQRPLPSKSVHFNSKCSILLALRFPQTNDTCSVGPGVSCYPNFGFSCLSLTSPDTCLDSISNSRKIASIDLVPK